MRKTLCAAGFLLAALVLCLPHAGCDGDSKSPPAAPKEKVYPAEGHAYMHDPVFKDALKNVEDVKRALAKERAEIVKELDALVASCGSRAKAEATDAWKELQTRAKICEKKFAENRVRTAELVRARITRAQADSEKIKRGEAEAIEISK